MILLLPLFRRNWWWWASTTPQRAAYLGFARTRPCCPI
jgi:hypothetical protein